MAIRLKVMEDSVKFTLGDSVTVMQSTSYEDLTDKPEINGVELYGDKSLEDLGIIIPTAVSELENDEGYLTEESDPVFSASVAAGISSGDITAWNGKSDFSGSYNDLTDKPTIPTVPTNVSAFTNDAGYLSSETDPTVPSWAKQPSKPSYTASEVGALPASTQIPSKVSDLQNDSGFISTETDPTVPAWAKASNKPTYTAAEVGALPDSTTIPSKTSQLQNDSGFITSAHEVPSGGSSGQVLAKASGTDYDLEWVNQSGGSGGAVDSVNGKTGVVVLDADDVGAMPDTAVIGYKEAVSVGTAQVGTAVTGTPNYTPAGSITLATEQQTITPGGEVATMATASQMTLWLTAYFSPIPVAVNIPTRATLEGSGVTFEIQEVD